MRTMQMWLDEYGESHLNPINKAVHWICVPAIFFSLIGLLSLIPLPLPEGTLHADTRLWVHFGTALLVFGLLFFLRLSFNLALGVALVSGLVLYAVRTVNLLAPQEALYIYLGIFVVAWIGQFIGHKIEGKKPSFFKDVQFLLIGPAWLLHFIYRKLGISY